MRRLDPSMLGGLPAAVRRPAYDRSAMRVGIVHLGIGAFHRAHQAVYVDDRLAAEPDWAILGASLRSADTAEALNPQEGLYSLAIASASGVQRRVIGSIRRVLVATTERESLLQSMTDPAVRIVSTTVTEKGYCHDPATGALDEAHPDVIADLAAPSSPCSAPGLIVEALARRRANGIRPFTVLPCDNLPSNGRTVKRILSRFAALRDTDLGLWLEDTLACPSTMVDRIVPATTDADRSAAAEALGVVDAWPVRTEPFSQWVLEDAFSAGRPDFAAAGAQMVGDVAPFERMKLRMLNGSHSTLAYLGYLGGYETIADTVADPAYEQLARDLMTLDMMPTLVGIPDLPAYRDALMARFANPELRHRTWQIAMDGSQKLPQRLLGAVRERLAAGHAVERPALAVAAWLRYVAGRDDAGNPIDVRDPLASRLADIAARHAGDAENYVAACLGVDAVFGTDLPADPRFAGPVLVAFRALVERGARAVVRERTLLR